MATIPQSAYVLRIYSESALNLVEDNARELEIASIKKGWENVETGRARRAEELRLKYLQETASSQESSSPTLQVNDDAVVLTDDMIAQREAAIRQQLESFRAQRDAMQSTHSIMAQVRASSKTAIMQTLSDITHQSEDKVKAASEVSDEWDLVFGALICHAQYHRPSSLFSRLFPPATVEPYPQCAARP